MPINKNKMLEIGQKVKWEIGVFNMQGVVLEDFGSKVLVQTHFRDNCPHVQEATVFKDLLIKN